MIPPTAPAPRPLCAVFAPLLPLVSSGALEDDEAASTREHVAGCAWCQQELARYTAVDGALRQRFGAAAQESILPFRFDVDGDEDAEDYAFILEGTVEETMSAEHDQRDSRLSATTHSSRWDTRRRGPGPRATAIAGVAAALILVVVATTIYTQFASRRTPHPSATATPAGSFTRFQGPRANANIGALAPARDGSLWFSEGSPQAAKLGHILPNGDIAEFALPVTPSSSTARLTESDVYSLTVGPDGTIWYIQTDLISGANQNAYNKTTIGRMTLDGAVTTFPLPINVKASQIAAGADGALWFVQTVTDASTGSKKSTLARITTDGQVTQFPAAGTGVTFACVGPDNAIWYTNDGVKSIGRLTTDGKVQEFTIPYYASWLTSGPDGALWYAEGDYQTPDMANLDPRTGYLGRIATTGVATELPIDPKVNPVKLTAGSDGALWFLAFNPTDHTTNLGRITPSGETEIIPLKDISQPGPLTAAPGALWVLDSANNTFWRYRLPK